MRVRVRLPFPGDIRSGLVAAIVTERLQARIESGEIQALGQPMPDTKTSRPYLCVYADAESCAWTPLTSSSMRGRSGRVCVGGDSFLKDPGYLFEGSRLVWWEMNPTVRDTEPVSREVFLEARRAIAEHFPALREVLGVAA